MKTQPPTILALDAHGGDFGPAVTVGAALDAIGEIPELEIVMVGLPQEITPLLPTDSSSVAQRIRLHPSNSVIAGDARPVSILRKGQGSSLWNALQLVADREAHACVSAGNTVALLTLGVKLLGLLPGIRRPAFMSQIPSARGLTSMLDLGANLNVDAGQLVQFAIMGSVVRGDMYGGTPSVGLLNVGHEDGKGHSVVKEAHERLQSLPLNYRGFVEGHDIFEGKVDVAVCDGFAGNLILKSSEGLAGMLLRELKKTLNSSWRARMGALLAGPALRDMLARFDPAKHNGAPLLGLNSVVVKSHGRAGRLATKQAILEAVLEAEKEVPGHIGDMIQKYEAETKS